MSKMSKNIMRWFFPSQILPPCSNSNVVKQNMWLIRSCLLRFNIQSMPLQVWHPLHPNQLIIVIIWLNISTHLSYVNYNLRHLLPWYPNVRCVSCNNNILNIIYSHFQYQYLVFRGKVLGEIKGTSKKFSQMRRKFSSVKVMRLSHIDVGNPRDTRGSKSTKISEWQEGSLHPFNFRLKGKKLTTSKLYYMSEVR